MKLKNFQDLIEQRFSKAKIKELEEQADLEAKAFRSLQESVKNALLNYMKKNKIGFNEMTKLLNSNPTQMTKIQRGTANLTLASIAHIAAAIGEVPSLNFGKKK